MYKNNNIIILLGCAFTIVSKNAHTSDVSTHSLWVIMSSQILRKCMIYSWKCVKCLLLRTQ